MTGIVMIGATGLVGGKLARILVGRGHAVTTVGRRACGINGVEDFIAPVGDWSKIVGSVAADVAISALGTTIKAAGSQEAFAAIDRGAVVAVAKATPARHWLMVSSVGADFASRSFYLRVKGQAEAEIAATGAFDRIDIFQPGLLLGDRSDHRPGEAIAQRLGPVLGALALGPFDRFGPISADVVAAAMAAVIEGPRDGLHRYRNRDMRRLAEATER